MRKGLPSAMNLLIAEFGVEIVVELQELRSALSRHLDNARILSGCLVRLDRP